MSELGDHSLKSPSCGCSILLACVALAGCGEDPIDAATAEILQRVPIGAPFAEARAPIESLGYKCELAKNPFTGPRGDIRVDPYLACLRDDPLILSCKRRTRTLVLQHRGRMSEVLVNSDVFCL